MKNEWYSWIMERQLGSLTIREQAKACCKEQINTVLRAYEMANLGWKIADLKYNDRLRRALKAAGR